MPLTVISGPIILAGESLSDGVDCSAGPIARLTMPADWTPANLTFQISSDGNGYNDLFDISGKEVMMPVVAGAGMLVPPELTKAIQFIKFRSGSRDHPVVQPVQRDFSVAIEVP